MGLASNGTLVVFSTSHRWFMLYEVFGLGIHRDLRYGRASSNPSGENRSDFPELWKVVELGQVSHPGRKRGDLSGHLDRDCVSGSSGNFQPMVGVLFIKHSRLVVESGLRALGFKV